MSTELSKGRTVGDAPTLRVHLWLESGGGMVFGLGRVQLLDLVRRLGSLNKAAKELGMSYRAAWGRIKRTEEALGESLLAKASGRKGYELTPLAEALLRDFALWHQEVESFALERAKVRLPWDIKPFAEDAARKS
ncbi:molybdate transport system regulatory protein [Humidesulfovibrio mexicanus]|jgi:molybdate transport system regulatory protein|uniref:Molybdate transport system regulatory protein n=1 Tax=Humidesulfovibrio mexicanus TaxID=147047 RepID=A0A238Y0U8_9BACT|nr:LysR family transcriptional regulator [Humidesulfovibrio mexicanus]SNR64610.1 molybdate transport system regulatory protein [Humidesulfovibrio mexicanus]